MGPSLRGIAAVLLGALPSAVCATAAAAAPPAPTGWVELRLPADTWVGGPPVTNARGDIAGAVVDADDAVPFQWWQTPLLWPRDSRDPVPTGPTLRLWDEAFAPTDINDDGVIALRSAASGGYLWRDGERTDLVDPPWLVGPSVVNDRGEVAGELVTPPDPAAPDRTSRAFLWRGGRFTELPTPAGWNSTAVDINNRGEVLGRVWSGEDVRGVVWRDGTTIDLGGRQTDPVDLNDRGQVIGDSAFGEDAQRHPFLWRDGVMTDLLAGSGSENGWVAALNNAGQIVGSIDGQPVVWRDGRPVGVGVPGRRGEATAVNDRGEVAGVVRDATPEGGDAEVFTWHDGRTTVRGRPAGTYLGNRGPEVVGIDDRGRVAIYYQRADGRQVLARTRPPASD